VLFVTYLILYLNCQSNLIKNKQIKMKLSKIAILAVRGVRGSGKLLAEAIGVSEVTMSRYLRDNDDNLTKAAALAIIRELTGLTDDEILIEEPIKA
jgi:transcriptional regulator with XRE-family HTH domain